MMKKERFKSVLLVLLFIVSLTFTQELWFYLPFSGVISLANNTDLEEIDIDVTDILSPQSYIVSFGGGYHTVFFSEPYEVWKITEPEDKKEVLLWETAKSVLKVYLKNSYVIQEIPLEEWKKIKKFKSIRMDFACGIPSSSFINALSGNDNNGFEIEGLINTVLIPGTDEEKKNIYLGNYDEDKYFKLTGSLMDNKIRNLIENIEKKVDDRGYAYYASLKDIASVDNDVLVPIFDETFIPSYSARNQIDVSDNTSVKSIAQQFFGRSFDFVKEITEIDGTYIYMYGYGEKSLKINRSGMLEYIEKEDRERISPGLDFLDSLKYAVKFVEDNIKWPVNIKNAYLSDYEEIKVNNKTGYRFSFNYRLNGLPVFIPDIGEDRGIEVEIIGNQITCYRRIVKRLGEQLDFEDEEKKPILNILEVLRRNSDDIRYNYETFSKNKLNENEDLKIEELIDDIELVYYLDRNDNILKPVWEITIDNKVYYFDLYTGKKYTMYNKD